MRSSMKHRISASLITTAVAVIVLAIVASLYEGQYICVSTIYQVFLVNILLHIGLWLFEKIECPFVYLEILGELGIILVLVLLAGLIFKWFESVSLLVLSIMGVVVYAIACFLEAIHIHKDIHKINLLLAQNRRID